MDSTPKSNRLHIALFGRTNVGKSSFLNCLIGQDISITSQVAGTTTDVVEKAMELAPLGPVLFIDTAGLGDTTVLSGERLKKTEKVFQRCDIIILVTESGRWTEYEEHVLEQARRNNIPCLALVNKTDIRQPSREFLDLLSRQVGPVLTANSLDRGARGRLLESLKSAIAEAAGKEALACPCLISDLVPAGKTAVLVVPIDLEAPRGRLILPQVQTIRDLLDSDAVCVIVKERELSAVLNNLKEKPKIVVCDSQVVLKVAADTPLDVPVTTFSILFARLKADIAVLAAGAAHVDSLGPESRILIAEACTHHPIGDDIGRVKIPRWFRQYLGFSPVIDVFAGRDYPENVAEYGLIVHCGGCMFNRRQLLSRLGMAADVSVPITNYGICISLLQGVLERTLAPFPHALSAYKREQRLLKRGGNHE